MNFIMLNLLFGTKWHLGKEEPTVEFLGDFILVIEVDTIIFKY